MATHEVAHSVHGGFYHGPDSMVAPHLPVGSPERTALFKELRKTFAEDWKAAELAWRDEQRSSFGDLYFVTAGNAVKIGRTTNFDTRLRFIQAHNHERVECLALLKGHGWRERGCIGVSVRLACVVNGLSAAQEIEAEIERLATLPQPKVQP